ncbi:MAG: hypothetical protein IAI49_00445 [Candidatus Eremiobacteraeota bacterium]|nr:hypothetical protein [Candidatus Eremiobacteraeota bacterium]
MRSAGVVAGHRVFGAATFAFGVVTLALPDYYDWLQLHWGVRDDRVFAYVASAAQIVGGAAIQFRWTARAGAAVLGVIYLAIALLSVPRIVAAPHEFYPYGDFFNEFVLVLGAALAYTSSSPKATTPTIETAARISFAVCAASFTLYQALYLDATAHLVPARVPPSQMFWAVTTTVFLALATLALVTNRMALLATRLLTSMLALFGTVVWVPLIFWNVRNHFYWTEAAETFAIAAAVWVLADLLRKPAEPRSNRPR